MTISREQRHLLLQKIRCFYHSRKLLWILVGLGIVFHSWQYFFNRSLWVDEASLAMVIINSTYSEFLQPLKSNQVVPLGFLAGEKFLTQVLGDSEYALRLIPFLSGILSLFLFLKVAPYFIRSSGLPVALVLLVTSNNLVYYSSAFKQYSSDVVLSLFFYAIAIDILSKQRVLSKVLLFGVSGALALWYSHPAVFVLAGVGGCIGVFRLMRKEWTKLSQIGIAYIFWLSSFAILYFAVLRVGLANKAAQQFFAKHFMPLPPSSLSDMLWFVSTFFDAIGYALGVLIADSFLNVVSVLWNILASVLGFSVSIGLSLDDILKLLLSQIECLGIYLIGGFIVLVGCFSLYSQDKRKCFLLLSPMFMTLLASSFQVYPFHSRLILFLVPSLFLLLGEGAAWVREKTKSKSPVLGLLGLTLIVAVCIRPVFFAGYHLIHPYKHEEARPVLRYLKEHKREEDIVYVYYASSSVFKYYSTRLNLEIEKYIQGIASREDWRKYIEDLQQLRGKKRVWLFFSHAYSEEAFFLYYLDSIGKRLDSFKDVRASVYLYDLR